MHNIAMPVTRKEDCALGGETFTVTVFFPRQTLVKSLQNSSTNSTNLIPGRLHPESEHDDGLLGGVVRVLGLDDVDV